MENTFKRYEHHINKHPNFTMLVRNVCTSKVTGSSLHETDLKKLKKSLKVFKKKSRDLIYNNVIEFIKNCNRWEDVMQATVLILDYMSDIKNNFKLKK